MSSWARPRARTSGSAGGSFSGRESFSGKSGPHIFGGHGTLQVGPIVAHMGPVAVSFSWQTRIRCHVVPIEKGSPRCDVSGSGSDPEVQQQFSFCLVGAFGCVSL